MQTIRHDLQASWSTTKGHYATGYRQAPTATGWRHLGDTPAAVLAAAREWHTELSRAHPDALALKVDILESAIETGDDGEPRRLGTRKINQWPAETVEAHALNHLAELRDATKATRPGAA